MYTLLSTFLFIGEMFIEKYLKAHYKSVKMAENELTVKPVPSSSYLYFVLNQHHGKIS